VGECSAGPGRSKVRQFGDTAFAEADSSPVRATACCVAGTGEVTASTNKLDRVIMCDQDVEILLKYFFGKAMILRYSPGVCVSARVSW
jgi:hypothetical protein